MVDRLTVIERWQDAVKRELDAFGVPGDHDAILRVFAAALHNAGFEIVPAEQLAGAVVIIETARQELRDAIAGGNPQVLREYAEDAVEAMSAFLDQPGGRTS